jgi:shikimate dehydrogenase
MHTASFQKIGFDGVYTRRDVPPETLKEALEALEREGFSGLNLTIPHKQLALPMMDELSPEAKRLGAVNTVRFEGGKWQGHNTDGPGFLAAAKACLGFSPEGETAAVIGCGGAGRAVALSLAHGGVTWLGLIDVDANRAQQLADEIEATTQTRAEVITVERLSEAHLVAQCSPSGLAIMPEPAAPASAFRADQVLYDIVIPPGSPETPTMRAYREAGGTCCANGVRMLVEQGALSFAFWTGIEADREAMLAAVEREVAHHE